MRNEEWDDGFFLCSAPGSCKQLICCDKRSSTTINKISLVLRNNTKHPARSSVPLVTVFSNNQCIKIHRNFTNRMCIANQTLGFGERAKDRHQVSYICWSKWKNRQLPAWTSVYLLRLKNAANPENPWKCLGVSLFTRLGLQGQHRYWGRLMSCKSQFSSVPKARWGQGEQEGIKAFTPPDTHPKQNAVWEE